MSHRSKGGRYVELTTWLPSWADSLGILEASISLSPKGLPRERFIFYLISKCCVTSRALCTGQATNSVSLDQHAMERTRLLQNSILDTTMSASVCKMQNRFIAISILSIGRISKQTYDAMDLC